MTTPASPVGTEEGIEMQQQQHQQEEEDQSADWLHHPPHQQLGGYEFDKWREGDKKSGGGGDGNEGGATKRRWWNRGKKKKESREEEEREQVAAAAASTGGGGGVISVAPPPVPVATTEAMERRERSPPLPPTCCERFCSELNPCQDWFSVRDPVESYEPKIDVAASFAPDAARTVEDGRWCGPVFLWHPLFWKFVITVWTCCTFAYSVYDAETKSFYLAYLTNWAAVMATFYQILSFVNSMFFGGSNRTPQPPGDLVSARIKLTWAAYTVAVHSAVMITILYWLLVYDPDDVTIEYLTVALHGGTAVALFFEGLYVNRVPLRMMHWIGIVLPFDMLYVIWTVVHGYLTDIGNPNESSDDNDPDDNDDAIYDVLAWDDPDDSDSWIDALIYSAGAVFVLGPIVYVVLWLCSIYPPPLCFCCGCMGMCGARDRRRYVRFEEVDTTPTGNGAGAYNSPTNVNQYEGEDKPKKKKFPWQKQPKEDDDHLRFQYQYGQEELKQQQQSGNNNNGDNVEEKSIFSKWR